MLLQSSGDHVWLTSKIIILLPEHHSLLKVLSVKHLMKSNNSQRGALNKWFQKKKKEGVIFFVFLLTLIWWICSRSSLVNIIGGMERAGLWHSERWEIASVRHIADMLSEEELIENIVIPLVSLPRSNRGHAVVTGMWLKTFCTLFVQTEMRKKGQSHEIKHQCRFSPIQYYVSAMVEVTTWIWTLLALTLTSSCQTVLRTLLYTFNAVSCHAL